jgi:hypothetical protein
VIGGAAAPAVAPGRAGIFLLRTGFGGRMFTSRRLLVVALLSILCLAGCSDPNQGSNQDNRGRKDDEDIYMLLKELRHLKIEGIMLGGPSVGLVHNKTTRQIVSKGGRIIPYLIQRLDSSGYDESVYIVFCLHELKAKKAKKKILEVDKALKELKRFTDKPHDLTLKNEIDFFLQEVEDW